MGILPVMSIFIFIFVSLGQALACQLCEKILDRLHRKRISETSAEFVNSDLIMTNTMIQEAKSSFDLV